MRGIGAIDDGADRRGTRKPTPLTAEIIEKAAALASPRIDGQ